MEEESSSRKKSRKSSKHSKRERKSSSSSKRKSKQHGQDDEEETAVPIISDEPSTNRTTTTTTGTTKSTNVTPPVVQTAVTASPAAPRGPPPRKRYQKPPTPSDNSVGSGYALPTGYKVRGGRPRLPSKDTSQDGGASVASGRTTYTQVSTVSKLSIKDEKPILNKDDPLLMDIQQKILKAERAGAKKGYTDILVAELTNAKTAEEILKQAEVHMPAEPNSHDDNRGRDMVHEDQGGEAAQNEVSPVNDPDYDESPPIAVVDNQIEFDAFGTSPIDVEEPATPTSVPNVDEDFITVEQFEAGLPAITYSAEQDDTFKASTSENTKKQERIAKYNNSRDGYKSKRLIYGGAGAFCLLVVLVIIVVPIVVTGGKKEGASEPTESPTMSPAPTSLSFSVRQAVVGGIQSQTTYDISAYNEDALGEMVGRLSSSDGVVPLVDRELTQQYALLCIYFSMGGVDWINRDGWEAMTLDAICDEWWGVNCNTDRIVVELDFPNNGVLGSLPEEIGLLTALTHINFQQNAITGTVPTTFGVLTALEILDLGGNRMSGPLSTLSSLESLSALSILSLARNRFTGLIPSPLVSLQVLDLESNEITGSLNDVDFGAMTALVELRMADNQLTGTIPTSFGSSLLKLDLGENRLTGTLPTDFSLLEELSVRVNSLGGPLPVTLSDVRSLVWLDLAGNAFTGQLPEKYNLLQNLVRLDVSDNALEGSIPSNYGALRALEYVNLSRNELLTGVVPQSWCDLDQRPDLLDLLANCQAIDCPCCSECSVERRKVM